MLQEGIIDRKVKFTPVLDGFRMPEYIDWELQPFSNNKVQFMLGDVLNLAVWAVLFSVHGHVPQMAFMSSA